jgi:hypothetical protein
MPASLSAGTHAALDTQSLEANRHGRLSTWQQGLVRTEMVQRPLNAWAIAAVGVLLPFAIPSLAFRVLVWLIAAVAVIYLASKGYDYARDSAQGQVAAITSRFAVHAREKGFTDGVRVLVSVRDRQLWVPTRVQNILASPAITVYFTPRARVVVNVEPALPERAVWGHLVSPRAMREGKGDLSDASVPEGGAGHRDRRRRRSDQSAAHPSRPNPTGTNGL